jgi:hypothetical protein
MNPRWLKGGIVGPAILYIYCSELGGADLGNAEKRGDQEE